MCQLDLNVDSFLPCAIRGAVTMADAYFPFELGRAEINFIAHPNKTFAHCKYFEQRNAQRTRARHNAREQIEKKRKKEKSRRQGSQGFQVETFNEGSNSSRRCWDETDRQDTPKQLQKHRDVKRHVKTSAHVT